MTDASISEREQKPAKAHPVQTGVTLWRVLLLAALISVELLVLSLAYTNDFDFVCRDAAPAVVCAFLSRSVTRAIAFIAVGLIFAFARPRVRHLLFDEGGERSRRLTWLCVQIAGFVLILAPWTFASDDSPPVFLTLTFAFWLLGGSFAAMGACFVVAPWRRWRNAARELGPVPLGILGAAILAPEITDLARGLWWLESLRQVTFRLVVATLDIFGVLAMTRPEEYWIGTKFFAIAVGSQCSGVEGFALVTFFLLSYFYAFRAELRFPHVWVLLPVGLVFSWLLNVVRIAVLFTIGARVSPDLAVNGFHSHAGWLMFSILALSIIGASRAVPWFRSSRVESPARLPLRQDWVAACIVPFAAFMGAALLLSTFTETPALWYVVKVVFMAGALAIFLPLYSRIHWTLDPVCLAAGAIVGVLWLVASARGEAGDSALQAALAALPAGVLSLWIVLRMAGTVVLVPIVEELFFRGYVLQRLDRGGMAMRILALCVSSGLFAALHDRWVLAAIAGLVYGILYIRSQRISDAIIAHAASNAVIAVYAAIAANWALI